MIYDTNSLDRVVAMLSELCHCPNIEHVTVDMTSPVMCDTFVRPSFNLVLRIHTVVQAWRSQHAANVSLLEIKDVVNREGAAEPLLQETYRGLERLDILLHNSGRYGTRFHVHLQHGCQDLVAIKARIVEIDTRVIMPAIQSVKHPLRRLELVCTSIYGYHPHNPLHFEPLCYILGSPPELQHLKLKSTIGLNKAESIAILQGRFQEGLNRSAAASGWACRNLESLDIRGLWREWP